MQNNAVRESREAIFDKKTILIICRELSEASLLSQFRPKLQYRYIIASDDIRVHRVTRNYPWVTDTCSLEQPESFYLVAEDVIRVLEVINCWLASLGGDRRGVPSQVLFWSRIVEGGMTTQRIQDALLLIRSYRSVLAQHSVAKVMLLHNRQDAWEDLVLVYVAQSLGIKIERLRTIPSGAKAVLDGALVATRYVIKAIRLIAELGRLRLQRRKGKTLLPKSPNQIESEREIVLELFSSQLKHNENIMPLMRALLERGQAVTALTWRAARSAELVRAGGLCAEELEHYVPSGAYFDTIRRLFQTWKAALQKRQALLSSPAMRYESVPLGRILAPSFIYFLVVELFFRCLFFVAIQRFLEYRCPAMIKLWGGTLLAEGLITLRSMPPGKRILTLEYWLGMSGDYPYEKVDAPADLYLATGQWQETRMQQMGIPGDRIVMVGQSRYDALSEWIRNHSPDASRLALNIPPGYSLYVLLDTNATIRGYLTLQEQMSITQAVLEFARAHAHIALLIKPHPSHQPGILEEVIESAALPNVFLVEKDILPYHALNASDVVITKFSTIGVEAMLMQRPVISVILDGEPRWKSVLGNGVEYVWNTRELSAFLDRIVGDVEFRSGWREASLAKQADFLKLYFIPQSRPSADIAVEAILRRLEEG